VIYQNKNLAPAVKKIKPDRPVKKLPKQVAKNGQIRIETSVKDINSRTTYFAHNGSRETLTHFTFSAELLKNIKDPHFKDEFKKLLNILDRHGYEGMDHETKKGIVMVKNHEKNEDMGIEKFKLKAPSIDLEIYGEFDSINHYIAFSDFYLVPEKKKQPSKREIYKQLRKTNRL
jgi:hypothetical protein